MNSQGPLASLCLFFYNQENFVEEAIDGALSQTYDNCEIILSDDHSSDRTYERILEKVSNYNGGKKIIVNRNAQNMGLVPHTNKVIYDICSGDYIFLTGGDDICTPNRVEDAIIIFERKEEISMVNFSAIIIDENGAQIGGNFVPRDYIVSMCDETYLKSSSFMIGASSVSFRRDVKSFFGSLNQDCQTEDSAYRFRAALLGEIYCSSKIGLKYRVHGNNISIGPNVYKLKTDLIANQYKRDLEKRKSFLNGNLYLILKKKIEYYINYRNISEVLDTHKLSKIQYFYFRIKKYVLRKKYEYVVNAYLKIIG